MVVGALSIYRVRIQTFFGSTCEGTDWRKFKTIQQDKLRGFPISFLANFLQDYFHNLKKCKEQEKRFKKVEGFIDTKRDPLTKRALIILKDKEDDSASGSKKSKKAKLQK